MNDVETFNKAYDLLDGNVLFSTVYFSYLGAFPSEYRDELAKKQMFPKLKKLAVPH